MLSRLPALWQSDGPLQWALRPLSWLYGALVALRRWGYSTGLLKSHRLDVPVIVVGNRIAGGAGKTPALMALLERLRAAGRRPGVVSRGYGRHQQACRAVLPGATAGQVGDEPLLIQRRCGVPVWVGADRVAAARALRAAHPEVDLLVCDDGLQHLRLARDIEIVVFDERGAGNGALLPAGPLREPLSTRSGAAAIVLYNAPAPTTPLPGHVAQRRLQGAVALPGWWAGEPATPQALAALQARPVLAAAGLAWPQRFFAALRAAGLQVQELPLPDHFDHATLMWPAHARDVIVTEKDAVKLDPARMARERPGTTVWVAPLVFEPGPAFFDEVLAALGRIESARPPPKHAANPLR
jgi:tetraacyldisaccharide 4'-kinase